MSDLAALGLEFTAQGADQVNRALDDYAAKAGKGAAAADSFETAQRDAAQGAGQLTGALGSAETALDQFVRGLLQGINEEMKLAAETRRAAQATRDAAAAQSELAQRARTLKQSYDPLGAAIDKVNDELREGQALFRAGAITSDQLGDANQVLTGRLNVLTAAHAKTKKAMGLTTSEAVNMGRQFSDIGVQLAMGTNPLMILVQQGPQIADVFVTARQRGVGFGAVLKQMLGWVRPIAPALGVVGVAAGLAFGAAALAARDLNKSIGGDLTKGMGLTEKQLKRLKDEGVNTAVTIGDVFRGTFDYIGQQLATKLEPLRSFMSGLFDDITKFGVQAIKVMAAAWMTGVGVIKNVFANLPAIVGDATTSAVNLVIRSINFMIEKATGALNGLIAKANAGADAVGLPKGWRIGALSAPQIGEMANSNAGAIRRVHEENKLIADASAKTASRVIDNIGKGLRESWVKAGEDRIRKQAGDPGKPRKERKGPKDPRDMSEERAAQIAAQIAQAKADELQAQLALTRDIKQRVALQRQIIEAELTQKIAQVDKQLADINDPLNKSLSAAKKQELSGQLATVKAIYQNVADLKGRGAIEEGIRELRKQDLELDMARRDNQLDLLKAQEGAAKTETQRYRVREKILLAEQDQERARLEAQTDLRIYTEEEVAFAKERLKVLPQIFEAQQQQLRNERELFDVYHATVDNVRSFGDAFKEHDWVGALESLIKVIDQLKDAFGSAGTLADKIQGIGGLVAGIGGMIGGRAGRALQGAGSGAVAGFQLGGMFGLGPLGAIAGGLFGGISSLFGGNKQKRAERRAREQEEAEEKARKAQEIAQEKRELELRLIEASGDKIKILAAQRDKELQEVDASNRALLRQVQDAEDRLNRYEKVRDIEIEALRLAGDEIGALNKEREREIEAIDATLQPLQRLVYAAQDASAAVEDARDVLQNAYDAELTRLQDAVSKAHDDLSTAYDREAGALQDVISRTRQTAQELRDFRKSLDMDTTGLSPENAYNAAKAQYTDVRNRAMLGDKDAQAQFVDVANAFKQASADYYGFSPAYFDDIEGIKQATDWAAQTAERTADRAQQQLDALNQLVSGYLDVNESTISVHDAITQLETAEQALKNTQAIVEPLLGINQGVVNLAQAIANYQAAVANQTAVTQQLAQAVAEQRANPNNQPVPANDNLVSQGYQSTNGDYAAYVRGNADLLALFNAQKGMAKGRTMEEFGLYHWANFGMNEARTVRAFAKGGRFMVGGSGGTDSQRVQLDASPDERVTVETPQQMGRETAAMERLAAAQERVAAGIEQLILESKADKRQRAAGNRLLQEGFEQLGYSFETGARRTGTRP